MKIERIGTKLVLVQPDGKRIKSGDAEVLVHHINTLGKKIESGLHHIPDIYKTKIREELI